jgi:A/G-specific adenine glycosylase
MSEADGHPEAGGSGAAEDGAGDVAGAADALPEDLDAVREALTAWYEAEHRSFPWRETTDPYAILVCEVMSQQTQLDRIVEPWEAFLERWPTPADLAAADRADVVSFWSGHSLGYNNRARYLHEAADQIVNEFDGEIPSDVEELQELTGVGPYTSNAVASFAFDDGDAVVDTNVERVLYRAYGVPDEDAAFERVANALMPAGESRIWNNAVMELGATVCGQTPECERCPWREWCHALETGDFTAPDVPTQPSFEGSRRQMRGRVVSALGEEESIAVDALGHRIRVDYSPNGDGDADRSWLRGLLDDLADDGLVTLEGDGSGTEVSLRE